MEGSLNLQDEAAREIVKDAFQAIGSPAPQQSFLDRQRAIQQNNVFTPEVDSSDSSTERPKQKSLAQRTSQLVDQTL